MLKKENKTDVIVVGAGPAGISCAITLARAGKEVVVIERGMFAGSQKKFFRTSKQKLLLKDEILNIILQFLEKMIQLQ